MKQRESSDRGGTLQWKAFESLSMPERRAWVVRTREQLLRKMQRERAYLSRRAARGIRTPTDEAYEADQRVLAELLRFLEEVAQALE